MSTPEQELMALERGFWTGGADFYRAHLDDSCLVVFSEMAGVMTRESVARTAQETGRWRDVTLEPKGLVQPAADIAIVSYEARATRASGEAYAAMVSSGYVRRADGWKMIFHQQTPVSEKMP